VWETGPEEKNAIHIVRLEHIGHETPVDDQSLDTCATSKGSQPTQGLHLDSAYF
jgi:hypothetical protein